MPTLMISSNYCGNEKEGDSFFDIDDFCQRCEFCNNDACKECADKNHPDYHPDCYEESQKE